MLRSLGAHVATGNWRLAAATAGTAYGVALVGALLFMVLLAPDLPVWEWLVSLAAVTTSAFTVDLAGSASGEDIDVSLGIGAVPLVLTTLSLAAACWVFRRGTRRTSSYLVALGDAARAGVLLGALLLVTALVFRTGLDDQTDSLNEGLEFFGFDGLDLSAGINRVTAFFLGVVALFVVLALAALMRRDWLGPRLERVHDVVAPPLTAIAALAAALPVLGLAGYLALLTGDVGAGDVDDGETEVSWHANLAVRGIALSNVGAHFLSIGAGGRVGGSMEFDGHGMGGDETESQWGRLGWLADQTDAWGLWFAIPLMLLTVAVLTWLVHRVGHGRSPLAGLLVWGGGSFLVFGWLLRLASVHAGADIDAPFDDGGGTASISMFGGSPFVEGLLLGVITLVAAIALAAARGLIDVPALAARLRELQTAGPATPPPPPSSPPPPGPPPSAPPPAEAPPTASPDTPPAAPGDETWRPPEDPA